MKGYKEHHSKDPLHVQHELKMVDKSIKERPSHRFIDAKKAAQHKKY